jgi:hypothetical protein
VYVVNTKTHPHTKIPFSIYLPLCLSPAAAHLSRSCHDWALRTPKQRIPPQPPCFSLSFGFCFRVHWSSVSRLPHLVSPFLFFAVVAPSASAVYGVAAADAAGAAATVVGVAADDASAAASAASVIDPVSAAYAVVAALTATGVAAGATAAAAASVAAVAAAAGAAAVVAVRRKTANQETPKKEEKKGGVTRRI